MTASDFLTRLFQAAQEHYPDALKCWEDEDDWGHVLASFGREAVPALLRHVRQRGPYREIAMSALGLLGKDAQAAVPVLVQVLKEKVRDKPSWAPAESSVEALVALQALSRIKDPRVVPKMIRILTHGPEHARPLAAGVCKAYGRAARAALPALGRLTTEDADEYDLAIASIEGLTDWQNNVRPQG